jgi:hypothetical protein
MLHIKCLCFSTKALSLNETQDRKISESKQNVYLEGLWFTLELRTGVCCMEL